MLGTTVLSIAALRWLPLARRHAASVFLGNTTFASILGGLVCASVGGLELPWYFAVYAVPGLTIVVLLQWWARLAAATLVSAAWSVTFFSIQPSSLEGLAVYGVLGFQIATVISAAGVGHMIFRLTRRDWQAQRLIRRTFGRYFSQDVADALLVGEGDTKHVGEERAATILFSDLASYSTLVEGLAPESVVEVLNRYFSAMQQVIEAHHGTVLEYIGDAILVVFGAPRDLEDHATHATRCAMEMRGMLAALNNDWEADGLAELWQGRGIPALRARIGIHSGRIVAGNIGSATFMKYGVVGDAVIVASRLESLNKGLDTDILVSESVYEQLPESVAARGQAHGPVLLKGRQEEIRVFSL